MTGEAMKCRWCGGEMSEYHIFYTPHPGMRVSRDRFYCCDEGCSEHGKAYSREELTDDRQPDLPGR